MLDMPATKLSLLSCVKSIIAGVGQNTYEEIDFQP